MEPEEVLELIRSAPERYDTVRAALRYRGDGNVHKEIRERIASTEAGRRAGSLVDFLMDELRSFTGAGWEQEDDISLVTLRRSEP
jgi:hypothetical protein